ncbi:MAG TPA: GGDEF domain-containing protein [Syntrophomonadaceae bacterium]|nr:GGDEF domain-containing protein [Syntrophomonadaceae bacterium]
MNTTENLHKVKQLLKYSKITLALYVSVFYGLLIYLKPHDAGMFSDIFSPLGILLSLLFMVWSIKYHSLHKPKKIWIIFSLGTFSFLLGDLQWAYNEIAHGGGSSFPSNADIYYSISAVLLLIAFFLYVPKKSGISAMRSGFDIMIMMTVYLSLEAKYIIVPEINHQTLSNIEKLTGLMYPIFDASLFVAILFMYFNEVSDRRYYRSKLLPLIAVAWVVIDEIYSIKSILGTYQSGSWLDPLWPASFLLLAFVALGSAKFNLSPAEPLTALDENSNEATIRQRIFLTYTSLMIFLAIWCFNFLEKDPISIGSVIIIFLIILRQVYSHAENRKLMKLLITSNDDLKEANSRIEYELETDYLTRLYNRRYIDGAMSSLQKSAALVPTPFSILILDIDHFKNINDHYGHSTGDRVLQQTADLIKANIRKHDIAGRWGGEEFIVLLPDTDKDLAYTIGERIRTEIEHCIFETDAGQKNIHISVSVGISEWAPTEYDFSRVLLRADQGMYEAKEAGRNRTVVKSAG